MKFNGLEHHPKNSIRPENEDIFSNDSSTANSQHLLKQLFQQQNLLKKQLFLQQQHLQPQQ
jgi:hypothetical protein